MSKRFVAFCLFLYIFTFPSEIKSQGIKDLRINEILVYNTDSYQDDYGVRSGWFEIYNSGYSTINIGGCFLTNDPNNPKKYRIPKTGQHIYLKPQNHLVFFAYNKPTRGAMHVNFFLDDTTILSSNKMYIGIYDQSGKNLIDNIYYNLNSQKENISIGILEGVETPKWKKMERTTPNALNNIGDVKSRSEIYGEKDPFGIIITITSMSIVFLLLLFIAISFKFSSFYFKRQDKKQLKIQKNVIDNDAPSLNNKPESNTNDIAAIVMALHLYINDNYHEDEPTGFTIKRELNQHTSWENKTLNFRKNPYKK